jgi:hypothetical protein
MNLVSTTKKKLNSSQQNWKLNPIPFGTSNHSLISQTTIKAPIYIKTPRPPPPIPIPYNKPLTFLIEISTSTPLSQTKLKLLQINDNSSI